MPAKQLATERQKLLAQINEMTDRPLLYLSFVWLLVTILELRTNTNELLEAVSYAIWGVFILDFLVELTIAPSNKRYLRENWLIALSLLLPALRVFRLFGALKYLRLVKSLRSLSLVKIVASLNRGISSMRNHARHLGVRYIFLLSSIILFIGAAGILNFERPAAQQQGLSGMDNYGDALWWTIMLMTTIGSEYVPHTAAGRMLTVVISFYAIAIFGYVTAILASLLIEKKSQRLS